MGLGVVAERAREQLPRAVQRLLFGFFAGGAGGARQRGARRNIIGLAVIDVAELIRGQLHLPGLHIHLALAILFRLHNPPSYLCSSPFCYVAPALSVRCPPFGGHLPPPARYRTIPQPRARSC